jgi:hypothetical protein
VAGAIGPREGGVSKVERREHGMGGVRGYEPARRKQIPYGVRRPVDHEGPICHARQGYHVLESNCWAIAAAQRASEGHSIRGRRQTGHHENGPIKYLSSDTSILFELHSCIPCLLQVFCSFDVV